MKFKKFEIFCGTGGVGKTTLATSRALALARSGVKVLLVTIDPAKRLRQVLNMPDINDGVITTVSSKVFGDEESKSNYSLDTYLISPRATLERFLDDSSQTEMINNKILNVLAQPNGGMNEIISLMELHRFNNDNNYQCIIVDTAPGKHFIDFLNTTEKVSNFFDSSYIELFKYLNLPAQQIKKQSVLKLFVKTGMNKLLSYLEKVTGKEFVQEFLVAINAVYGCKEQFLESLSLQPVLKDHQLTDWYLVTSVEQKKINEAKDLQKSASQHLHQDQKLVINKSLKEYLSNWQPEAPHLKTLKASFESTENSLIQYAKNDFEEVILFPEIMVSSPIEHVLNTSMYWERNIK